jgi:hypothetical protein
MTLFGKVHFVIHLCNKIGTFYSKMHKLHQSVVLESLNHKFKVDFDFEASSSFLEGSAFEDVV